MICFKCKNSMCGKCNKFGSYKTDEQIKADNYECFQERIHKVNKSMKYFDCDENVYLDEMNDKEIYEAMSFCNRIRNIGKDSISI